MAKGTTVTEFILARQKEKPEATGAFTALLAELIVAAKIIAHRVQKAGLSDDWGLSNSGNLENEHFQRLVEFANHTIINRVSYVGYLWCMASKLKTDVITIPSKYAKGEYILVFDPLGGVTSTDVHPTVGTIFSILKKQKGPADMSVMTHVLQPGVHQVAAGYFLYGSSIMMVYSTGTGVQGFTLDPAIGEFLLSHENIRMPKKGKTYNVNEGNYYFWDEKTQEVIEYFKSPDTKTGRPYSLRYTGSFVADFHHNLLTGGIYMYPADGKDPMKANGKRMLMCEVNPLAFVASQAGGAASTGTEDVLQLQPEHLHQRIPVFIGSQEDVGMAERLFGGKK